MSVYDGILRGLNEAIEHTEGKRQLRMNSVSIQPLRSFSGAEIKALRLELKMTQIAFAEVIGVSVKTIQAWEAGRNLPGGPARRMMAIFQADPQIVRIIEDRND